MTDHEERLTTIDFHGVWRCSMFKPFVSLCSISKTCLCTPFDHNFKTHGNYV